MTGRLWRMVEARLRRTLPAHRADAVLTDLAEDYADRRQRTNTWRAALWLILESRSLSVAYRRRELQTWLSAVSQDGRYAVGSLRRRPLRFLAAVSLLAVAIGLTTAMFTVVDALSLRPVPFKAPDQLATLYMASDPSRGGGLPPVMAAFTALRQAHIFAAVEGVWFDVATVQTDAGEVRPSLSRVTPGIFDLLGGVRPLLGRMFDADDGSPGRDDRVLISETLWRESFHGDANVIGRTMTINRQPSVIVGVLPASFRFPNWNTAIWQAADFETPAAADPNVVPSVYVRYPADVPSAEVLRRATTVVRAAHAPYATLSVGASPLIVGERDRAFEHATPILIGGVVLLFLVLCANVSSLQLAGVTARGREFATRSALGATRGRLVRQAFIESAVAGAGGVALGIGLGAVLVYAAQTWLLDPLSLHTLNAVDIDARTLAVTSVAGLIATLSAGVLPAAIGTQVDAGLSRLASRSATESPRARAAARVLLVCQIALSCTLLVAAVLSVRSFVKLVSADRGLDTRNIVVARIDLPESSYGADRQPLRDMIKQAVTEQARAIPGVTYAAWSYGTPPSGATRFKGDFTPNVPGMSPVHMEPYVFRVDPDFFRLYEIPILRGRVFQATDPVATALVGERFAATLWPGLDPIGRTFSMAGSRPGPPVTVVGVVKELRFPSLDRTLDAPQFYTRLQGLLNMGTVSLRCSAECSETVVRQRLEAAYPGFEVYSVKTLESAYARELARPRASAGVAVAFAITALLAAAAGLFSLLSQVVARRRREFGIRAALGASAAQLRALVVRDGCGLVLIGVTLGSIVSLGLSQVAASFLFNMTTTDPWSWVAVFGALTLTAAAALSQPARAAVTTNPVLLLRDE
jgi:predicted permease